VRLCSDPAWTELGRHLYTRLSSTCLCVLVFIPALLSGCAPRPHLAAEGSSLAAPIQRCLHANGLDLVSVDATIKRANLPVVQSQGRRLHRLQRSHQAAPAALAPAYAREPVDSSPDAAQFPCACRPEVRIASSALTDASHITAARSAIHARLATPATASSRATPAWASASTSTASCASAPLRLACLRAVPTLTTATPRWAPAGTWRSSLGRGAVRTVGRRGARSAGGH
jgi:hypothetical protein